MTNSPLARATRNDPFEEVPGSVLRLFGQALPAAETAEPVQPAPTARAYVYGPDTADLFERASEIVYPSEGGTALQPQIREGWRTYNFEVEDLHTYIAGGLRVHNTSIPDILPEGALITRFEDKDKDGKYDYAEYTLPNGAKGTMQGRPDANGNTMEVVRTVETPRGDLLGPGDRVTWHERYENKTLVKEEAVSIEYARGSLQGEEIGRTLGSVLGSAIGTKSVFAQVGSATIAATLLQNVGEFLHKNVDFSLLASRGLNASPLENAVNDTFHDLGKDLKGNAAIQVNAALSSILIGEIADALNLQGFERGVFSTVGNTVTNQVLSNLSIMLNLADPPPSVIRENVNLLDGFNFNSMALNVANSLGGYFGSQLGNMAVKPKSPQSALFGSAAAAVGTYVASTAAVVAALPLMGIPLVGPLIAAFAAQALGNLVGNAIWDDDRVAHYTLFTDANGTVQYGYPYTQDGASLVLSDYMAKTARDSLNSIYGTASAHVDPSHAFNPFQMGWYVNNQNQKIMFTLNGAQQTAFNLNEAQGLISASVDYAVANSDIAGGDLFTRRAYMVSHKAGLAQLSFDLQVAKDFRKYVENTKTINSLIADSPESDFSAGWIATLQRARELGLGKLANFNAMEYLAANEDLQQAFGTDTAAAERHMLEYGVNEPWRPTFDAYQYLAANPGLAQALGGIDRTTAARHYIEYGLEEERPTEFDTVQYLAANPDLARQFGPNHPEAAMRHYIEHGAFEGRGMRFDYRQYLVANPDLIATLGTTDATAIARHYVETGLREGRSTRFENYAYLASNPDLWQAFGTNVGAMHQHALTYGIRPTSFDAAAYLAAHDDLRAAFGTDLEAAARHFIDHGRYESWRKTVFYGGPDGRTIVGGAGSDTVSYANSPIGVDHINLAAQGAANASGYDTLVSIENAIGSRFNDTISGNDADNVLEGNGGSDSLYGNGGTDTISFEHSNVGVVIDFKNQNTWDGQFGIHFEGIENAIGSRGDDFIVAHNGDNVLDGNGGSDTLYGGKRGRDTFVFRTLSGHTKVGDFISGSGPDGEILRISRGLFANDDPIAAAADINGNVVMTSTNQSTITLVGVQKSNLSWSNIQIV